ncbi:DUF2268 domain-containing protein [Paenibacillus hodogayensis]|uniref:DUF2268 domain-containing protein n=1 Tax=Paenibacillus hodogayensis TaxID=279208 RepID=A0ABV5VYY2_9BACL
MNINAIDTLRSQRTVLEAEPERRAELYRELVVEPLQPIWETILARIPAAGGDRPDPVRLMGLYDPTGAPSEEEGLRALTLLERAGTWEGCVEAARQTIDRLRPEAHGIVPQDVLFTLALADSHKFAEPPGYTGSGGTPGQAIVIVWPSAYNIPRLPAIVAHELHHNVRLSYEPWTRDTTVGQYLVMEGLAEAFAAELYGEERLGPWVSVLDEAGHEEVKPRYREALHVSGFNDIRGYMFGDLEGDAYGFAKKGLPPYAGYAVGYRIVTSYLRRSGKTAAEATYLPWQDIVEGSGYLEEA